MTFRRIGQQSVFDSVEFITGSENASIQLKHLGERHNPAGVFANRRIQIDPPGAQSQLIVGRSARNDAVEIVRVAYCLHDALPPTGRAAAPIRKSRTTAVE